MLVKNSKKLMQDPFIMFAIVGIFIFFIYYSLEDKYQTSITLSSEMRAQLTAEYQAITGLKASPDVVAQLEKDFIVDEILFRDAINAGMHLIDPTTRLSLIEKMRFRISALIAHPSDVEIINYYAQNMQRYYTETSLSFEHLYFKELPKDAEKITSKLNSKLPLDGDRFMHGNQFSDMSEGMLRGIFGADFLASLRATKSQQWEGPISSNHGLHYVRLQGRTAPQPMPFSLAKNIIANDLMQIKIDQAVESKIQILITHYEINIEP
jgi:hypothetical protein